MKCEALDDIDTLQQQVKSRTSTWQSVFIRRPRQMQMHQDEKINLCRELSRQVFINCSRIKKGKKQKFMHVVLESLHN